MKKIIMAFFLIGLTTVSFFFIFKRDKNSLVQKNNIQEQSSGIKVNDNVCQQFSKELVTKLSGKNIVKTEQSDSGPTHVCRYYVDENNFLTIRLNYLSVANQKKGQLSLDRKNITDPRITMDHFIVVQENGLINGVYLILNENSFLAIDRSSTKAADENGIVNFAALIAAELKRGNTNQVEAKKDNEDDIAVGTEKKVINDFFNLINSHSPDKAVNLMSSANTDNDSTKQAWAVQFNAIKSVEVKDIQESMSSEWTDTSRQYKVTLQMTLNESAANAPIPYYGYENGENIRFIRVVKEDGSWKIETIATGP